MKNCFRTATVSILAAACLAGAAWAQTSAGRSAPVDLQARLREVESSPKLFEAAYKVGKNVATFCANCHGEGGNSVKPDIPNLAGQNTQYIIEQVRQFSEGRRKNEFMEGLIKALNPDEKVGIVVFYSSQEVVHRPATDPALAAQGKSLYDRNCFRCHGEQGRGSDKFARIAGQQSEYLSVSLKRYRSGTGPRVDPLMAASTRNLSDNDIRALVAYVASMK